MKNNLSTSLKKTVQTFEPRESNGAHQSSALQESEYFPEDRSAEKHRGFDLNLSAIVDASPAAIIAVDPEGFVLIWNKAAERIFGWSREEAQGHPLPIVPSSEWEAFKKRLGQELEGAVQVDAFRQRRRKDGTLVDVSMSTAPLRNGRGFICGSIGILIDVTERRRAQQTLTAERAFLQTVIDGVADPIMAIGLDHRVLLMNRAAQGMLPTPMEADSFPCCHELLHRSDRPCQAADYPCPMEKIRQTGKTVNLVHRHNIGTEERIFELTVSPLRNADGSLTGIIEISRDITERLQAEDTIREKEERLNYLAFHDPLTHLPNRALFNDRLQHAIAKARRTKRQIALLFLDLDLFKKINDTLGYQTGDKVLCEVALRLRGIIREADTIARLGGDEYVIILEELQDLDQIAIVAQKILLTLAEPIFVRDLKHYMTGSIGISIYPTDGDDPEGLLKAAEVAMYRAKQEGRCGYQLFRPEMNARSREKLVLEAHLRDALENDQLLLYYQPQFDLSSGKLIGVEALMRWQHPHRGLVPPAEFIPLAEECGLIVPMGEWALRAACQQGRFWLEEGFPEMRLAVNVSARQFRQSGLVQMVSQILTETLLPPECLELEITESTLMEDVEAAIHTMKMINHLGVHLAIDDFGTGYSSLGYLKRFPVDRLKIDRSFVKDVTESASDAAIASSVIALAQNMGLEVVAEGIETMEQLAFLRERGCHFGQGYFFSPPVAVRKLEEYLRKLLP